MTATQSKAVTRYVIEIVSRQLKDSEHGSSSAAIGSVLQRLATCSNGQGVVDQSIPQLHAALDISESVIKRVLRAASTVGVLVTIRKGGGPNHMPTQRQMRLDYHGDGQLYLFGESRRHDDPSSTANGGPTTQNTGPITENADPLGAHTKKKNFEEDPSRESALTASIAQKAEEVRDWMLKQRAATYRQHIRDKAAWERTVRQDIANKFGDKINSLVHVAPLAPVSLIASCAESGNSSALNPFVADSTTQFE